LLPAALGSERAVDVLVETALERAHVPAEAPVGVLGPALVDVGGVGVTVAGFSRVGAGDDVPPLEAALKPPGAA